MKRWTMALMVFAFLTLGYKVLAQVEVNGNVYEQDTITPIEAATVTFLGISTSGDTVVYQFTTNVSGHYSDSLEAGSYRVWASAEGYATTYLEDSLYFEEGQAPETIDFLLYELFHPVHYVEASLFTDDLVCITWSMQRYN